MNTAKTRADLFVSFSAQIAYKAIGFAVLALIARHLTGDQFGQLMFVLALTGALAMFTELGSSNYLVREIAQNEARAPSATARVLRLRLPLLVIFLIATNLFVLATAPELAALTMLIALYAAFKEVHATFAAFLVALRRIASTVVVFGLGQLVLLAWVVAAVFSGASEVGVALGYFVSGVTLIVIGSTITRIPVSALHAADEPGAKADIVRQSLPLFAITALSILHFKVDTLMLGFMTSYAVVGIYEAAARLFEASQFLIRPATLIFFPICAQLAGDANWSGLRRLVLQLGVAAFALGAALSLAVFVAATWLITLVYGAGFGPSVECLSTLYLSVPGLYVTIVATFVAISLRVERTAIWILGCGVALNVVLNLVLIPAAAALGAAIASVVSQSMIALCIFAVCARKVFRLGGNRAADRQ